MLTITLIDGEVQSFTIDETKANYWTYCLFATYLELTLHQGELGNVTDTQIIPLHQIVRIIIPQ